MSQSISNLSITKTQFSQNYSLKNLPGPKGVSIQVFICYNLKKQLMLKNIVKIPRLNHLPDLRKDSPFSYSWTKPIEVLPALYTQKWNGGGPKVLICTWIMYYFFKDWQRREITEENIAHSDINKALILQTEKKVRREEAILVTRALYRSSLNRGTYYSKHNLENIMPTYSERITFFSII